MEWGKGREREVMGGGGHRSWMMGSSWPTESAYPQRWRGRAETQNKRKD